MSTILFRSCWIPFRKPPFSACRRSFWPTKLTKSIISFKSCWVPFELPAAHPYWFLPNGGPDSLPKRCAFVLDEDHCNLPGVDAVVSITFFSSGRQHASCLTRIKWDEDEFTDIGLSKSYQIARNLMKRLLYIIYYHLFYVAICWLTLLMLETEYFVLGATPCLPMLWLLKQPVHQKAWYWLCGTDDMCMAFIIFKQFSGFRVKLRFISLNFHSVLRMHSAIYMAVLELVFRKMLENVMRQTLLTHWGRVTHICVSNQSIISSDNDLSPSRHQAIIWTNSGILLVRPLGTNASEILI